LIKAGLPYLFDCKPQLIKFLFRHFVRLIVKGGLLFLFFDLIQRYISGVLNRG